MSWHQLELRGSRDQQLQLLKAAGDAVWAVYMDSQDKAFALFSRHSGGLALTLYFPPRLTELAEQLGATPCVKPAARGLNVYAGDLRAR